MVGDEIRRYGIVAAVGMMVGVLFHAAIVVADAQGTPAGILVSALVGATLFVVIDALTEE